TIIIDTGRAVEFVNGMARVTKDSGEIVVYDGQGNKLQVLPPETASTETTTESPTTPPEGISIITQASADAAQRLNSDIWFTRGLTNRDGTINWQAVEAAKNNSQLEPAQREAAEWLFGQKATLDATNSTMVEVIRANMANASFGDSPANNSANLLAIGPEHPSFASLAIASLKRQYPERTQFTNQEIMNECTRIANKNNITNWNSLASGQILDVTADATAPPAATDATSTTGTALDTSNMRQENWSFLDGRPLVHLRDSDSEIIPLADGGALQKGADNKWMLIDSSGRILGEVITPIDQSTFSSSSAVTLSIRGTGTDSPTQLQINSDNTIVKWSATGYEKDFPGHFKIVSVVNPPSQLLVLPDGTQVPYTEGMMTIAADGTVTGITMADGRIISIDAHGSMTTAWTQAEKSGQREIRFRNGVTEYIGANNQPAEIRLSNGIDMKFDTERGWIVYSGEPPLEIGILNEAPQINPVDGSFTFSLKPDRTGAGGVVTFVVTADGAIKAPVTARTRPWQIAREMLRLTGHPIPNDRTISAQVTAILRLNPGKSAGMDNGSELVVFAPAA
ncbi:MAG: hypothetical protein K2Y39_16525, partial [Candidatus Obscuribacterales bacterium]|nr:hypothetical protein [Candidatus Obscuribacterales bacterium]